MDKPPTKAKRSAFDDEAKELDQRLRQLIGDYAALFLRYPHVEGRPSVEAIDKAQVLAALRVHPWRKKLSSLANELQREAFGEGQHWFLQTWIDNIPEIVARCEWDVQSAARNLITTLPASLRLKCPDYPGAEDRDALGAATVAVAARIRSEVEDSKRCKDPNPILIGRIALEAMGYEGARYLRLLRPQKKEEED